VKRREFITRLGVRRLCGRSRRAQQATMRVGSSGTRRDPLQGRKVTLEMLLAKAGSGIPFQLK
jgi:hypothetical protein